MNRLCGQVEATYTEAAAIEFLPVAKQWPRAGVGLDSEIILATEHRKETVMGVTNGTRQALALVVAAIFAASASAQQYVYPAKGQSPAQQQKDEGECHTWAVKQSKYDPANPPKQAAAATPPTTATGTTPGAGARGAARGAVVGGMMGDAGAGAAAGAVAARGQSRRQNAGQAQQQQQAAAQQDQAGVATYQKARAACLEGRGYTVK